VSFTPFFVAWNDRDAPATLPSGWLAVAQNPISLTGRPDSPCQARPGITMSTERDYGTTCCGVFAYWDDGEQVILYATPTAKLYTDHSAVAETIHNTASSWTATELLQFVRYKEQVYFTTGKTGGGVYGLNCRLNSTGVHPMGVIAPAAAPLAAEGAAGNVTGTVMYYYSYYDPLLDRESNFSDYVSITVEDKIVNVTVVASADATFTHFKIYRTEGGGSEFRYLGQQALTNLVYADNTADSSLSLDLFGEDGTAIYHYAPTCACIFALPDGRVGVANDMANGLHKRIFICYDRDHPEAFPEDNILGAGMENGYHILSCIPFGNEVAVICEDGIWVINAECTDCDQRDIVGGVGRWGACLSPYGVFFVGREGVYLFKGYESRLLTDVIRNTWDSVDRDMLWRCSVAYDPIRDHLYVSVCLTDGGSRNDTVLALDCRTLDYPPDTGPRWSKWTLGAQQIVHCPGSATGDAETIIAMPLGAVGTLDDDATNDGVTSGTSSGTVTGAGNSTLLDSAAEWASTLHGRTVLILTGTGAGQRRVISSIGTEDDEEYLVLADAWTTNPDTTSTYAIGIIDVDMQTGKLDLGYPRNDKVFQRAYIFLEE